MGAADDTKSQIRAEVKAQLAELSDDQVHDLSVKACDRLVRADFFKSALTVMVYLPIRAELDITPVALRCFQLGKTVCAPRVDWEHRRMTPIEIRSFDDRFEVRRHGVREPAEGRCVAIDEIDLFIVPGIAFDASGARLGRGGGYFDRFLAHTAARQRSVRCGICFDFQIVDTVPAAPHDVHLDAIVTDRRLIRAVCPKPA